MTTKDEALQMALDALGRVAGDDLQRWKKVADPGSIAWHVLRAIATCREALAQKDEQEPVAWKRRLVEIHDALSYELGDTDPYIEDDMTDEEVREEMPVFWAAKEVATLIGDAPWDSLPSASPKRKPLTDVQISHIWDRHIAPVFGKNGINPVVFARAIEAAHGIGAEHDAR